MRSIDDEALYGHLQVLLNTIPDLTEPVNDDTHKWLARLAALVRETGELVDVVALKTHTTRLAASTMQKHAASEIKSILFRALAWAELRAPSSAQGAFIAAGNQFDAFSAVAKILSESKRGVLLVDPYMGVEICDFALLVPEGVAVRLLADEANVKPTLAPAVTRWLTQYDVSRPLEVRVAPKRSLHDRSIQVDRQEAWIATQSFNALAQRSPASLSRLDGDAGRMKIEAYEEIWETARVLIGSA
nr:hypothetical protein [uncultured Sphingomonas sp.]